MSEYDEAQADAELNDFLAQLFGGPGPDAGVLQRTEDMGERMQSVIDQLVDKVDAGEGDQELTVTLTVEQLRWVLPGLGWYSVDIANQPEGANAILDAAERLADQVAPVTA